MMVLGLLEVQLESHCATLHKAPAGAGNNLAARTPSVHAQHSLRVQDLTRPLLWHPTCCCTRCRFDQVEPYTGGAARVYGGDVIAHVDPTGVLVGVSSNVALSITAALPPTVGKASARRNQLGHVRGKAPAFAGAGLTKTELLVRVQSRVVG